MNEVGGCARVFDSEKEDQMHGGILIMVAENSDFSFHQGVITKSEGDFLLAAVTNNDNR